MVREAPDLMLGPARYSPPTRTVTVGGQEQRLEPRLADLLDLFIAHPATLLERDWLLERVWGTEGSDEALTQAVSKLRQTLGDRTLLRTEPRRGYTLVAAPEPAPALPEPTAAPAQALTPEPVPLNARPIRLAFLSGLIVGLLVATILALLFWPETMTIMEEVTEEPGQAPVTRTVECDGTPQECETIRDFRQQDSQ
ncbi:winged helix-turn-helix domain-containing protein [Sphingomicrobium aestuariivivum]|nr:winged helix-turn-helix domain-containing protein [Sphingomicrobium aestuariivivum]